MKKKFKVARIICPKCGKSVAQGAQWAPGYPTIRKHNNYDGEACYSGYLRESKVHGGWVTG